MFKEDGILTQLKRALLEKALQAEMQSHLGYDRYSRGDADNARNGLTSKTIKIESDDLEIEVPRDRNGSFEPIIVPKRKTRIEGLDDKIIALYAKGMSTYDISEIVYLIDRKQVANDLKPIYTAINEDDALCALERFAEKWNSQYQHIAKSWYANWLTMQKE